ncbi:MAG: COQ9 family protein [Pseudomonadota bacterium]
MAQDAEKTEEKHDADGFEDARGALLESALMRAPFEGWNAAMVANAAQDSELKEGLADAAFPGGVWDLLQYWSQLADDAMAAAMTEPGFSELRIREKVAAAVLARIDYLRPHKEAFRRAAALLATPPMAPRAARLSWKSADAVWRGLNDKSTDFNFYTKRAILVGVLASTLARWLGDDSPDEAPTKAFLDARIDNVMQFEKAKAQARKLGLDPAAPFRALAKLRYPSAR